MTKKSDVQVLIEARALLSKGWIQSAMSRNAEGRLVSVLSPAACQFCTLGAILHAAGGNTNADQYVRQAVGRDSLLNWNDAPGQSQNAILAGFDRAIQLAEEANV